MSQAQAEGNTQGFWGIVTAQFLGAFNDNALRWFLIALSLKEISKESRRAQTIALASALFLLPYLIFSMHAGALADRYSKRTVLMWSKAAEAAVMALCLGGLLLGTDFNWILPLLLGALFLLGTQAAYYSPAKFGVLPEILPERRLSWGNGIFEMTGVIAIILGSACGSAFVGIFHDRLYLAPAVFVGVALLGLLATWFVPPLPAADPDSPPMKAVTALIAQGRKLARHRILLLTLIAVVYIWSLGLLFQLNIALYAKQILLLEESKVGNAMAVAAIGVALGNISAGYLSGKTIEMGLVPFASLGLGLTSMALYFTQATVACTYGCVAILGFFAGLFIVPTHALLQEESPVEDKGGIWAATNFFQTLGMLVASGIFVVLENGLSLSPPEIFLVCGIGTLATGAVLMAILPEALGRTMVWLSARLWLPVKVAGQENVPARGPILFVVEGKPRKEGFFLLAGTRRFVQFVLPEAATRGLWARSLARALRFIPLRGEPPGDGISAAAERIAASLGQGGAISIFDGSLRDSAQPPRSGGDPLLPSLRILNDAGGVVVPVEVVPAPSGRGFRVTFGKPRSHIVPSEGSPEP